MGAYTSYTLIASVFLAYALATRRLGR